MNKLISTIATIVLCSFFSSVLTTPAEAKSRKHHSRHHHKAHTSHHSHYQKNPRLGMASWYGSRFQGKRTATGERFDMNAMTAAHNSLPLDSYVQVTNLRNQKSVIVRINDRGPFHGRRVMDLSYAAAKELGMRGAGTAPVEITPISELSAMAQLQDQPG